MSAGCKGCPVEPSRAASCERPNILRQLTAENAPKERKRNAPDRPSARVVGNTSGAINHMTFCKTGSRLRKTTGSIHEDLVSLLAWLPRRLVSQLRCSGQPFAERRDEDRLHCLR